MSLAAGGDCFDAQNECISNSECTGGTCQCNVGFHAVGQGTCEPGKYDGSLYAKFV